MNCIIGLFILAQALICLSQSDGDGSVELSCGLDKETLDKAKGALNFGTISLPILRCLCKLKGKTSGSGSADDVGIDLNIVNCNGVLNPDPSKKIEYAINIRRIHRFFINTNPGDMNSYISIPDTDDSYGNFTSTIIKTMKKDDCLYFKKGLLIYKSGSKKHDNAKYLINIEKDNSIKQICDEFDEGTDEYNFLKIVKYVLTGGNDCPIEKGTTSSVNYENDQIKISTNDKWPCGIMYLEFDLRDKPDTINYGIKGEWDWYVGRESHSNCLL